MPLPTVLVLGAQGRLGRAATNAFAASGWRVLAQARRPEGLGPTALTLPLSDTAALARAAQGARAVVYAVNPLYTRWDAEMLPLARLGMDVAERLGATFLLPGNVYAYGAGMPPVLTETTPEAPSTRKGALRQQFEHELAERAAAGRLRSVVLRAGDFFGPGQGTWLDLLIAKKLPQGRLVYPGPMDGVPHAWAYLPDLAQAFVAVAERRGAEAHERLHFEGHTLTGRELLEGLARAAMRLGWIERVHAQPMAWWPWQLAAPFVPLVRELLTMRYLWDVPHRLDGTRLRQRLGEALPHTPLDDALMATLRTWRPEAASAQAIATEAA
jgi:nucleoside-diphosphate-sugar epimerase